MVGACMQARALSGPTVSQAASLAVTARYLFLPRFCNQGRTLCRDSTCTVAALSIQARYNSHSEIKQGQRRHSCDTETTAQSEFSCCSCEAALRDT